MEFSHKPILLDECIDMLSIKSDGIYVDGTVGGAGHSSAILAELGCNGRLIAIDRDKEAVDIAVKRLSALNADARFDVVKGRYSDIQEILQELGINKVDGILLDIGVSSYQLDNKDRGFGYMSDSGLDMRMGADENVKTAYDIVNYADSDELEKIIRDYGEERWWRRIVSFIVNEREKNKIETTGQLTRIITAAIPAKARKEKQHPAKRTFQALRIAVNNELGELEILISRLNDVMLSGGRVAIISFHSLEDRIVKNGFRQMENPCICPPGFPKCVCGRKPAIKIITKKPVLPSQVEIGENPRARSAKLRVAEWL